MQNDNIQLTSNLSKTFPLGTVLNLKGSSSCLDLVGSQHRDFFATSCNWSKYQKWWNNLFVINCSLLQECLNA